MTDTIHAKPQIPAAPQNSRLVGLYFCYFVFLFATALPAGVLSLFAVWLIPGARNVFKDFKTDIPLATQWTLVASSFFQSGGWLILLLAVLLVPLPFAMVTRAQRTPQRAAACTMICLLLLFTVTMLAAGFVAVSLVLPMVKLNESVNGL